MTNPFRRSRSAALLLGLLMGFSTQAFAQGATFCWSETWGRGVGTIPTTCGADQEKNGALCYPKCKDGYASDGVAGCIQRCPAGAQDDGLFCGWPSYKAAEYPIWDEAKCKRNHSTGCWLTVPVVGVWVEHCRAGYKHVVGFCEKTDINCPAMGLAGNRIANSCAKNHYFRDTALPSCGSGQEYDAGLCYTACKDGADGVGPVCWAKGPPGWVQCGAGWAATKAVCDQSIAQQVISVVDAAVTTTMLIASMGATSAATLSGKAAPSVFSKAAWEGVKKIGKAGVKDVLVSSAKSAAIGAIPSVPDAVMTTTNGTIEQIWQIGQLEHDSPNMTQVERDHAIAQIALNTASWLDPTGMTGVVAAYTKPICKDVSAMQTRSLSTETKPTGGIAELMKAPQAVQENFTRQQAAAQAELAGAAARVIALQVAASTASGDAKANLQSQVTAAQAQQAAAKAELDKVTQARTAFQAASAKWSTVMASTGSAPAPAPAPAAPPSWGETAYKAYDIAAGANGAVWFIGAATQNGSDGGIFRVTPSGPQQVAGGAMRIAVDPAGVPWVVNSGNQIYRWNGSAWQQMPGAARDIGIGANGAVWVIGVDSSPYKWNGSNWTKASGGAVLVSVDPAGNPWVVNAGGQIWRHDGSNWHLLPGAARDIGVGADGAVFVVGAGSGNSQVYRWNPSINNWTAESGVTGFSVAAGPAGTVYVARSRDSGMPVMSREPR